MLLTTCHLFARKPSTYPQTSPWYPLARARCEPSNPSGSPSTAEAAVISGELSRQRVPRDPLRFQVVCISVHAQPTTSEVATYKTHCKTPALRDVYTNKIQYYMLK